MTNQAIGLSSISSLSNVNDIISENCDEAENCGNLDRDIPSTLSKLKIKNVNRLIIEHLNINSLPINLDQLKMITGNNTVFQS